MIGIAFAGFRHGHIYSLYEEVKTNNDVTLCGAWEENDAAKSEAKSVGFTYNSYEELLADKKVQIVAIGDYFGIRGKRIIKALKAGKNVITDKPVCTSIEELDEIESLLGKTGLKLGCMLDLRFCKFTEPVKKLLSDGTLGEITNVCFTGQHPLNYGTRPSWYFENGKHGGTINDIGVHGIDFIAAVSGLRVKKCLAAKEWNKYATEEPNFMDSAIFMAELTNGAGVISDVSYSVPNGFGFSLPQYWRFTIWTTLGMLEFILGGDKMMVAVKGERNVRHIKCENPPKSNLTDFILELRGGECEYDTAFTLKSSRDVLNLQACTVRD
ncbi:MAG: Gfo/Idh/MocA family oxidoreductase [Clostridiales bacterium]|nr:Gfo/Idh/MocA family oxidoreductase [Clostridiales bacterium]